MTLDELMHADPTESEYISQGTVLELLSHPTWRLYSSKTYWGMDGLIDRFLQNHARLKGLMFDEMYAEQPAMIIHFENTVICRGATFLNGAVLVVRQQDGTIVKSLFVDDETAEKWGYPDDYVYVSKGEE